MLYFKNIAQLIRATLNHNMYKKNPVNHLCVKSPFVFSDLVLIGYNMISTILARFNE